MGAYWSFFGKQFLLHYVSFFFRFNWQTLRMQHSLCLLFFLHVLFCRTI